MLHRKYPFFGGIFTTLQGYNGYILSPADAANLDDTKWEMWLCMKCRGTHFPFQIFQNFLFTFGGKYHTKYLKNKGKRKGKAKQEGQDKIFWKEWETKDNNLKGKVWRVPMA